MRSSVPPGTRSVSRPRSAWSSGAMVTGVFTSQPPFSRPGPGTHRESQSYTQATQLFDSLFEPSASGLTRPPAATRPLPPAVARPPPGRNPSPSQGTTLCWPSTHTQSLQRSQQQPPLFSATMPPPDAPRQPISSSQLSRTGSSSQLNANGMFGRRGSSSTAPSTAAPSLTLQTLGPSDRQPRTANAIEAKKAAAAEVQRLSDVVASHITRVNRDMSEAFQRLSQNRAQRHSELVSALTSLEGRLFLAREQQHLMLPTECDSAPLLLSRIDPQGSTHRSKRQSVDTGTAPASRQKRKRAVGTPPAVQPLNVGPHVDAVPLLTGVKSVSTLPQRNGRPIARRVSMESVFLQLDDDDDLVRW